MLDNFNHQPKNKTETRYKWLLPNSINTSQQCTKRIKEEEAPLSEPAETDIESVIEEVLNEVSFENEDRIMQYIPKFAKASERGVGSFSGVTLSQELSKERIIPVQKGAAKYEPVVMSVAD